MKIQFFEGIDTFYHELRGSEIVGIRDSDQSTLMDLNSRMNAVRAVERGVGGPRFESGTLFTCARHRS